MAWHAIDLIQPAIDKTLAFFKGPGLFWKWVKIGVLVFIYSMLSGGGSSFNFNLGNFNSGDSAGVKEGLSNAFSEFSAWFASIPAQTMDMIIIWIMVGIVILFMVGVLFTLLKNMAFFAILESISTDKVKIIPYMKQFYKKAFSLTFVEIVFGLIHLPFVLILLLAIASFFSAIFGFSLSLLGPLEGIASNALLMIPLVLISLIALFVLAIAGYILGQFAAYWMYISEKSAWQAFKESISLARQNLMQVIVLLLMQLVLGIAAAIICLLAVILIIIPFAIIGIILAIIIVPMATVSTAALVAGILMLIIGILIFSFVTTIILAPIQAFFFNYNLMFLKKLLPAKPKKRF